MKITHDFSLNLATAPSRLSRRWKNRAWRWSELVARCLRETRTAESVAEYRTMARDTQSQVKDVGGFVAAYLAEGTRRRINVSYRTAVTLDIDFGRPGVWADFCNTFDCAALYYTTHKHTPEHPRMRLVIPAARQMSVEEYEPVARYFASRLGIELFDATTYDPSRLFYWPSASRDGVFEADVQDGEPFDVDEVLATYSNWRDVSEWPQAPSEVDIVRRSMRQAADPLTKQGIVGSFCRAYTIAEVIANFLPDVYAPTDKPDRYSFAQGSVAGGLVIYDDKFAYSHHATDPAGQQLCNAFDLVRLHRFANLDKEGREYDTPTARPSFKKMADFAAEDPAVRRLIVDERMAEVRDDFGGINPDDDDGAWKEQLDCTSKGAPKSTIANMVLILENDPALKGHLFYDQLRESIGVRGGLPWDRRATNWSNRDDANLRGYFEQVYSIQGKDRIKDAMDIVLTRHREHPIREYLNALKWDGVKRLDTMIIDYLGAEDNELTRAVTRVQMTGAVARVMRPGVKFDYCLILQGAQGLGKSSLLNILGGEWYKDGVTTLEGKEGADQVRGQWLIELGELEGIRRSEITAVKQFISAQVDEYRPAYAVRKERFPRQCVFFGTTNEAIFLKDASGNRRFNIIALDGRLRRYGDNWRKQLAEDRDQLWAEAVEAWRAGEKLFLPTEMAEKMAERQQNFDDNADDPLRDVLLHFLEIRLPADWDIFDLSRRRAWLRDPDPLAGGTVRRPLVCPAEFICERMGRDLTDKDYKYLSRKVAAWLRDLGWEGPVVSRHAANLYGRQRTFKRPDDGGDEDL